jgi:hypothetical protein
MFSGTACICGLFAEHVRKSAGAPRSTDPIFSVAAIGTLAEAITPKADAECFGNNSCWRRFLDAGGFICNLNFDTASTFDPFRRAAPVELRFLTCGVPARARQFVRGVALFDEFTWGAGSDRLGKSVSRCCRHRSGICFARCWFGP